VLRRRNTDLFHVCHGPALRHPTPKRISYAGVTFESWLLCLLLVTVLTFELTEGLLHTIPRHAW